MLKNGFILANNMKYLLIQEALTNAKDDPGNDISDENSTIFVLTFWFSILTKEAYFQY